jgi:hypothetical protein
MPSERVAGIKSESLSTFIGISTRSFDMNPDLGNNARFLASVE